MVRLSHRAQELSVVSGCATASTMRLGDEEAGWSLFLLSVIV